MSSSGLSGSAAVPWPLVPSSAPGGGGSLSFWQRIGNTLSGWLTYLIELYQSGWRFRWLTNALFGLGVAYLALKALHRRFLAKYQIETDSTAVNAEYDYIVVGSGSSGAVVAARLAEDPSVSVLLLEAGGSDDLLNINCPAACIKLQRDPSVDWNYVTAPQKHAHGNMVDRVGHWPRGKVLGGSSSLNYMLFVRGAAGDFDSWAALGGGDAWTHKSLLPFFQKLESVSASTSTVKASPLRGTDGPMPCNLIQCPQETTHAFIESTASSGVCEKVEDYNAESIFGVSMSQYNVRGGRRWNTATAYLVPALAKYPNLHVLTHAHAQRVLFGPNKEALGVAIKKGSCFATMQNQPETIIRCRGEVILSGGAIGSPQLLELSGIGRPEVLTPLGIPIIAARSGVGENLQDHLAVPVFRESKVNTLCGADENIGNIFKFVVQGTGALTGNMVESLAWLKTPAHPRMNIHPAYAARIPDLQFHFLAGTIDPKDLHVFHTLPSSVERLQKLMAGGLKWTSAIMPTLLHPQSIGTVHITSKHAQVQPAIDPHYLERQEDVDCLVEGCLLAEKIYREPAIAKISGRDLCDEFVTGNPYKRTGGAPGEEKKYWEYYVRHQVNTLYHPVGTCKMGSVDDPTAVVDPQLRVIGVSRLRVIDASIMPTLPSGNTNVPAIMVGERGAEFLKQARKEALEGAKKTQEAKRGTPTANKAKL